MSWEQLLRDFRALGGVAENIAIRHGSRGRGLFPIDPSRPIRLRAPPNLLIKEDDTEVRDGQLVIKTSTAVGARERAFFDRYQQEFSWGAGVFDDLWQQQLAWSKLPQSVQSVLKQIWPIRETRFSEPSEALCHRRYFRTRGIIFDGSRAVHPIVELVNHGGMVPGFDLTDGVSVGGTFEGEVLVNYGGDDCWGMVLGYGFCEARNFAHSARCAFDLESCHVEISRAFDRVERYNGFAVPLVRIDGHSIDFPFLTLGNARYPHVPRAVLRHVMKSAPIEGLDEMFDLVQHHNRMLMLGFLRGSEDSDTPLVAMLRGAAYQQLETLSYNWGTRSLEPDPTN